MEEGNILLGHIGRQSALGVFQAGFAHMHRLDYRRPVLDDVEGLVGKAQGLAAFLFGVALGNRGLGRLRNRTVHGHQPVAGIFHMGSHGIAGNDPGIGLGGTVLIDRAQPLLDRAGKVGNDLHGVSFAGIGIADAQQSLVALGVKRVSIDHGL